jgi:hypothetical protein
VAVGNLFNFVADCAEGESKISILRELLKCDGTGDSPDFKALIDYTNAFVRAQFEEKLADAPEISECLEQKDYDRLLTLLGNGHAILAADGVRALEILEKSAVDIGIQILDSQYKIRASPTYEPVWDDLGMVQVVVRR